MKTFDLFVVELEKLTNDTITTDSGLELYVDTKYNEFEHRVTEGPVVAVPFKYDTGVSVGDTLYFHHLVVMNEGQPLTGEDDHYLVRYTPEHTVNNQAIAYKNKEGEISPLGGWVLLTPVEEDAPTQDSSIEVVSFTTPTVTKGRLAFSTKETQDLSIKEGDVVGFPVNRDYSIVIDGQEYYRVRNEDLLYVEE
jgi:co-chaperonin GroES (HSP10)